MGITVEFHPGLRHQVGVDQTTVETDAPMSVAALLRRLVAQHPRVARALVEPDGELDFALLVVIDDDVVQRREYANTLVAADGLVELHIALVGG